MKYFFRLSGLCLALLCLTCVWAVAQTPTPTPTPNPNPTPDPFIVQVTASAPPAAPSPSPSATPLGSDDVNAFVGDVSGNGRFVVFESKGDLATLGRGQTTRTPAANFNADGNREIFIWDAAQRRIYQITRTRSALVDNALSSIDRTNIAVEVSNNRPQISRDGKWIVFSSNAPTPGGFDGTVAANKTALQADGNQEIFIYQLPDVPAADLTSGIDPGEINLAAGTFTRVTDTPASSLPRPGNANAGPFVADDNRHATINDLGTRIAFVSTRDLTPCNASNTRCNADANPEIFAWRRGGGFTQITVTSGTFIFNDTPSISGGTNDTVVGERTDSTIAFYSNAKTMPDAAGANVAADNADGNAEIFAATYNGATLTALREVTRTKFSTTVQVVNLLYFGRRVSRDGNLILFETRATDPNANTDANAKGNTVFVYNLSATGSAAFTMVGPRATDAEVDAGGGDVSRFPMFTADDARIVFASTVNIKSNGDRADAGSADGLNPTRQVQLFTSNIPTTATPILVTRLTNISSTQGGETLQFSISNTVERIAFSLPSVELGGGNTDGSTEVYYLVVPPTTGATDATPDLGKLAYLTGASRRDVATPSATPTPTPSPTPSSTPLQGFAAGMMAVVRSTDLATVTFAPSARMINCTPAGENCDAASESHRRPPLPFELNGVSLQVANAAAGLYFVSPEEIAFEVPRGLATTTGTNTVPVVINVRTATGVRTIRSLMQIAAAQPDIATTTGSAGGRAIAFNVTNPLAIMPEPFSVTSPNAAGTVGPTVVRLMLTGLPRNTTTSQVTVRLVKVSDNTQTDITPTDILAFRTDDFPGLEQLEFRLPATLAGAGDVAVTVIFTGNVQSRPPTPPRASALTEAARVRAAIGRTSKTAVLTRVSTAVFLLRSARLTFSFELESC